MLFAAGGNDVTQLVVVSACHSLQAAQAFLAAGVPHVVRAVATCRPRSPSARTDAASAAGRRRPAACARRRSPCFYARILPRAHLR